MIRVALYPLQDSVGLQRWDHRTAELPTNSTDQAQACEAVYPTGEAVWGKHFLTLAVGGDATTARVDSILAGGRPWRLTLQLLPDGRCGIAVNGVMLRVASHRLAIGLPRHIVIEGQSVRTRILVDHIEVWRGVRQDIAWSRVDSAGARR